MTTSLGATATPFTAIIVSPATSADARATSVLAQGDRDQHKHIPRLWRKDIFRFAGIEPAVDRCLGWATSETPNWQ
jgi:hypothetical protein